jgi:multidrug efflux pump subunit AcrA (membrane-fusion protein)
MRVRFDPAVKSDPEQVDGMRVHYAPARRQVPRLGWYLVILLVASPLIYLVGSFLLSLVFVEAKGQVAPPRFTSVYAAAEGVVEQVAVRSGEWVQAGTELLGMEPGGPKAAPEGAAPESSLALAAASEVDRARMDVDLAREQLEKMKTLRDQGAATAGEVDQAWMLWLAALDNQARLQRETPRVLLAGAAAQYAHAVVYDGRGYRSSCDGQVLEVCVRPGQRVRRGETLMLMSLSPTAQIIAYLEPKYLRSARIGQRVVAIFADGTRMRGEVAQVEELAERPPPDVPDPLGLRRSSVVVRVRLDEPIPPRLDIAGMPVSVRF